MWIWKTEQDRLWREFRHSEVTVARLEAENHMLRESNTMFRDLLETAEQRNQSLFDMLMQIKHQHPGTGYQDEMKKMFQDGETIMQEDPEELRKYHKRMQDLQDEGADPGLVLLEEMDDLRSEDSLFGPGLPDES